MSFVRVVWIKDDNELRHCFVPTDTWRGTLEPLWDASNASFDPSDVEFKRAFKREYRKLPADLRADVEDKAIAAQCAETVYLDFGDYTMKF